MGSEMCIRDSLNKYSNNASLDMNFESLPENLPVPENDGAADHLLSMKLPDISLQSTSGEPVSLGSIYNTADNNTAVNGTTVIYIYPMTGRPDTPLPDGWDGIPGARGCTPQSCGFRDHFQQLQSLNANVFGLSTQTTDYQREAKQRLHLPFDLLSDSQLELKQLLKLPTFIADGAELYKRMTLIISGNSIIKVFYPVFPPGENASDVLTWLGSNAIRK